MDIANTETPPLSAIFTETPQLSTVSVETPIVPKLPKLIHENHIKCGNNIIKERIYANGNFIKLFKDEVDLTANITDAKIGYIYDNEHWSYKDTNDRIHLYKNSDELTKRVTAFGVIRHPQTGQWLYSDEKNKLNIL